MSKNNILHDRRVLYPQNITADKCSNYNLYDDDLNYITEEQRIFLEDLHLEQIETM